MTAEHDETTTPPQDDVVQDLVGMVHRANDFERDALARERELLADDPAMRRAHLRDVGGAHDEG